MTKSSLAVAVPPTQQPHQLADASSSSNNNNNNNMMTGLNRYLKLEKLGEGNYGCVYKARDRMSGTLVALKKIKLDDEDDGVPSTAIREVAILQDIIHQHIVRLEQVILEKGQLYLVFEYLDLDLRRYLDNVTARPAQLPAASSSVPASIPPKGLPMPLVKSYVYQILLGVEHMHSHRHLHRDLKPQNLLINREGRLSIADLGLARAFSTPMPPVTHEVATLWYRPSEILLGSKPYSSAVDLWAIGAIMAEMISLIPSFPGDSEIDTLFRIFQAVGTPTEDDWPGVSQLADWHPTFPKWSRPTDEAFLAALHIKPEHGLDADGIDLLRKFLTNCPAKRISARVALQHPWFLKDSLHNLSRSAKAKLDKQAASIAKAATDSAAVKKADKKAKLAAARQKRRDNGEEVESEEEFDQDQPMSDSVNQQQAVEEVDEDEDEEKDADGDSVMQDESSASSSASSSSASNSN